MVSVRCCCPACSPLVLGMRFRGVLGMKPPQEGWHGLW